MVERMLADFDRSYDLCLVVFRFFNACGANPEGLLGSENFSYLLIFLSSTPEIFP